MNYIKISKNDIANGPGVRVVLWVAGCSHHCKNCHNPDTWDVNAGNPFDARAKTELFEALEKPWIRGITLSGGDPMHPRNREDVKQLMQEIRTRFPSKDIWLYTGYRWEEIQCAEPDVVVDGEFKQELYSISLLWRGSSNQRLIDVGQTIQTGTVVLLDK